MADEKSERVWFITGSSSELGRLLAEWESVTLGADFPEEELFRAAR